MDVEVSGKNVELTKGLVSTAEAKVGRLAKFVGSVQRAEVRFTEERNPRIADKDICDLVVVGPRQVVRARAAATRPAAALDRVVDKAVHQVEKQKVH